MGHMTISTENAEYQVIQALKNNRTKRTKLRELFIEGTESLKQAIKADAPITRIIYADQTKLSDWAMSVINRYSSTKIIRMSRALYRALCDREEPPELLATASFIPQTLSTLTLPAKPFVLIFDRPSDYGNFGSIVRSADSFGVDAILVIGHGIDVYDSKVIRSSLGAIFHQTIVHVQSMQELHQWVVDQKRSNQLRLIGTDSTGSTSLTSIDLNKPIAVVLGNEAKGMSVALQAECDLIVSIPLCGAVNSLNVSCAGTILLWEVFKHSDPG
jgi:TrmH family RNA methyltransferase